MIPVRRHCLVNITKPRFALKRQESCNSSDIATILVQPDQSLPSGNDYVIDNIYYNVTPIPEPTTLLLLGSGLAGLAGFGKKRLFRKT